jgi:hypothetical protein
MKLMWLTAGVLSVGALLAATLEPETLAVPERNAEAGLLYGRVTTSASVFEGRLRWGGDQEALWSNYFNGARSGNPWAMYAPKERDSLEIFGITIASWTHQPSLSRPFMARFGDIARIDRDGRVWRLTLKSGAVAHIAWAGADDMNDGVRVWDRTRGVVQLGEAGIRSIELLGTPSGGASAAPLYGTVHTRRGDFTGLVQWNRKECLVSDVLQSETGGDDVRVPFGTIRSIARQSADSSLVTLVDGRAIVLSGRRGNGQARDGIYVDDARYGRVLVSWDAFERIDFRAGGTGPAYADFLPGRELTGTVITRSGRRLSGRLVYDLDETQTTETLDAPSHGIDYTIPFSLIASIALPGLEDSATRASVILSSGEALPLERQGDLGQWNAGILIFVEGRRVPEYVKWADVKRIDFSSDRAQERFNTSDASTRDARRVGTSTAAAAAARRMAIAAPKASGS